MSTLNISSSPHVRINHSTSDVMLDVILALMPATIFGIWHFGMPAFIVLALAILTAVLCEWAFCKITHRPNSLGDKSAIVTGLLLGLSLSPNVSWYVPVLGSIFAIIFVKCIFGGLGQNIMNPALAGRCFVMISFGVNMTNFAVDGVSTATPLEILSQGGSVDIMNTFLGFTNGTIGISGAALLLGGIYLILTDTITWHIPGGYLLGFAATIVLAGGRGFDVEYLLAHMAGGGLLMAAFFMATDPVTSPTIPYTQFTYGAILGILSAVFRIFGSAPENISFAMIIGDLFVPLLDKMPVPKPFGYGNSPEAAMAPKKKGIQIPKAAAVLTVITLLAGVALGGVNALTKDTIAAQDKAAAAAAYKAVIPGAETFSTNDKAEKYLAEHAGENYGTSFGKVTVNEVVVGGDAGYGINVTSGEGFDGNITVSVGIAPDGTVLGIAFTELHETAGMGMRADEPEWKAQFENVNTDAFTVVKGGKSADNQIDAISGATRSSNAVVNAVNAALDFYANVIQ